MADVHDDPLLGSQGDMESVERDGKSRNISINKKHLLLGAVAAGGILTGVIIGMVCTFAFKSKPVAISNQYDTLDNCNTYQTFSCNGNSGDMDSKYFQNKWNTPKRGEDRWKPGFQDMSTLTGYAQLKYASGMKSCTVNIITKTSKSLSLTYYFDGVAQYSNSKTFDSSYNKVLKVKVIAASGEVLELDGIDFAWNAAPIKSRRFDYRNGQKGAIVEMFGWPDDDIAQECQFLADAGYLGVKVFPHQEQVMSYQPFNGEMNPWYFMYQPVSYRLQGRMGTRDQLRNMINKCRAVGVRVYADAVVNHMSGNGNDLSSHRNPGAGCTKWGNKTSSAYENGSPYYTPAYTYEINPNTGRGTNVLEFPAVPYGPEDFHCDKALGSWSDPNILNSGWLTGLSDLDTSKDYVRQRIADFMIDLISIGFSGYRIDAAKHIRPEDLAAIFGKVKQRLGGRLPDDFISWLEVLTGGESYLLVQGDGDYSFTGGLTKYLKKNGLSDDEILKIKIWWSGYPTEPWNDAGSIDIRRKVIENDDHDQQNDGSSSRDMHDSGCVLIKGCAPQNHRNYELMLFNNPPGANNNKNDYPIRLILSSYYRNSNGAMGIPDGMSTCDKCTVTCGGCRDRPYIKAYNPSAQSYPGGTGYTYVHRDSQIIGAMQNWMA
ncbi:Alpha amylase, catalytic domain containing protein [Trichomonas vaginalis G3]|uniref:Alpha-amylase n=1 Tax=Trichomonas vaginalis (strain ATCC PRA-98 / G3) TaxID=412133 RepID=A2D8N6_TRIV3|nr:alpha-amylase family [Trichomonas vaginalis G3]EAY23285.1 Alpha amylase, catalytic domain containing protein [Trichomonas vaginalis G3]KAI5534066.1 alpha-amylase family [Trichomonas vaginalis G3]|eukprot:XP_001584271.1 Alpha amylase, catalytic domain containing protein [Trichomonas vaginalis G3]